jgi:L-gulonolactone oxidase
MKIVPNYSFKNWARNVRLNTSLYCQPETEAEIMVLLKRHKKVRVAGTAHSWSALCESKELLINLDRFNKVLHVDKENKTIRAQAGIKLHALNLLLDAEGLALTNLGSIAKQSLAGAITTGTHGTGIGFQCLASQVLEFTMIKADGERITCRKGDTLFDAAIISLGCLGIITEMTLQVSESFNIHDKTYTAKFTDVIENIDAYIAHDHFKLWWLPPTGDVVVYTYKRTDAKCNDSRLRQIFKDEILSVWAYRTMVKIGNVMNRWRAPINKFLTSQMKGPLDRIEKSFMVFNVPEPPLHRETEWAFDVKRAKEILTAYQKLLTETHHTFNFIQEIRFTKGDEFWLSECHGRDTIWIGAYNHEDRQWNDILRMFEEFAMQFDGRPHWGKEFNVRKKYFQRQYAKFDDFIALKREFDPENKFSNTLTDELFG